MNCEGLDLEARKHERLLFIQPVKFWTHYSAMHTKSLANSITGEGRI